MEATEWPVIGPSLGRSASNLQYPSAASRIAVQRSSPTKNCVLKRKARFLTPPDLNRLDRAAVNRPNVFTCFPHGGRIGGETASAHLHRTFWVVVRAVNYNVSPFLRAPTRACHQTALCAYREAQSIVLPRFIFTEKTVGGKIGSTAQVGSAEHQRRDCRMDPENMRLSSKEVSMALVAPPPENQVENSSSPLRSVLKLVWVNLSVLSLL